MQRDSATERHVGYVDVGVPPRLPKIPFSDGAATRA